MNFAKLDAKELAGIGISFGTEDETRAFCSLIRDELEYRIGGAILRTLNEGQVREYDLIKDPEDQALWLSRNCPDCGQIVKDQYAEMEKELKAYRDQISGIVKARSGSSAAFGRR